MHDLQPTHLAVSTDSGGLCLTYFSSAQGLREMMTLDDAKQKDGIDYLEVYMQANILSYVTDDLTGKIISGDNSYKIRMEYTIKFLRRSGAENSAVWRVYEMTGEKLKYPRHTFRR